MPPGALFGPLRKECFEALKKGKRYEKDLPKRMYSFFVAEPHDAFPPSFSKFARSIGVTLEELDSYRRYAEFERAWRDCIEIRRDYLTDCALTRRYDPSFVKYLLSDDTERDERNGEISVSIKVVDS